MPNGELAMVMILVESGLSNAKVQSILTDLKNSPSVADIPPSVTLAFTGNSAMMMDMGAGIGSDMITLLIVAIVLMTLSCCVPFSHVRCSVLPIVGVFCGLIMTFGIMGLFGLPISMVTIGALPILLGIGVGYGIQFHSRLDDEAWIYRLPMAIKLAVTKTGSAVFLRCRCRR